MEKKIIYGIDAAILVGTLLGVFFIFTVMPSANVSLSPGEGDLISRECALFVIDSPTVEILISEEGMDFSNARKYLVEDGLELNLPAGNYYIKLENAFDNFPKRFEVEEDLSLEVVKEGEFYYVVNSGDGLEVRQYNERGELLDGFNFEDCGGLDG